MNTSSYAATAGNRCPQPGPKPAEIQLALDAQKQALESLDKTAAVLRERLELVMDQSPPDSAPPGVKQQSSPESQVSVRIRENNEYITDVTAGLARIIERLQV